MTTGTAPRAHLVERAIEAMGTAPLAHPMPPPAPAERRLAEVLAAPLPEPPAAPAPRGPVVTMARLEEAGLAFALEGSARSKVMEELALIQHPLLRAIAQGPGEARAAAARRQVIMVTSARRGEGKSFTSLNLAASIAATTPQQVVLVDVDGGASSLTRRFGLMTERGLLSLAAEPGQPKEALLLPTAIERLSILPHGWLVSGRSRPPAADALSVAIRALAVALPGHLLILDTPPALSTSDAQALASLVGQVVLVVRAESTQRDEVEAALDLVEACPLLHLLLNRSRLATNDSFGAHGEYGASKDE
ncbi:MAG: Non-specific protein-tyrosine kinase [Rubritepida sp.]|nr:Non-specific protein-tyrosine kinase [Rubritepida sp.]